MYIHGIGVPGLLSDNGSGLQIKEFDQHINIKDMINGDARFIDNLKITVKKVTLKNAGQASSY